MMSGNLKQILKWLSLKYHQITVSYFSCFVIHQQGYNYLMNICSALVKTLDRSLDVEALSPSNLADLDVVALLNRYSAKLKKVF